MNVDCEIATNTNPAPDMNQSQLSTSAFHLNDYIIKKEKHQDTTTLKRTSNQKLFCHLHSLHFNISSMYLKNIPLNYCTVKLIDNLYVTKKTETWNNKKLDI